MSARTHVYEYTQDPLKENSSWAGLSTLNQISVYRIGVREKVLDPVIPFGTKEQEVYGDALLQQLLLCRVIRSV